MERNFHPAPGARELGFTTMSDAEPTVARTLLDLPEMTATVLDEESVQRFFSELAFEASVLDILMQGASARDGVEEPPKPNLRAARDVLLSGAVNGLQIRYVYVGVEWWDTLMRTGSGIRLVRVRK
jgi:hypothetical protein